MHSACFLDSRRSTGLSIEARPARWNGRIVSSQAMEEHFRRGRCRAAHTLRKCCWRWEILAEAQLTPAREEQAAIVSSNHFESRPATESRCWPAIGGRTHDAHFHAVCPTDRKRGALSTRRIPVSSGLQCFPTQWPRHCLKTPQPYHAQIGDATMATVLWQRDCPSCPCWNVLRAPNQRRQSNQKRTLGK